MQDEIAYSLINEIQVLVGQLQSLEQALDTRFVFTKCWIRPSLKAIKEGLWEEALFHTWSLVNESSEISMPLPVAIVQCADGFCKTIAVENVTFKKPEEKPPEIAPPLPSGVESE